MAENETSNSPEALDKVDLLFKQFTDLSPSEKLEYYNMINSYFDGIHIDDEFTYDEFKDEDEEDDRLDDEDDDEL